MIFMIDEENWGNIIKQAYRPLHDGRLVSVKYDLEKNRFSSVIIKRDGMPLTSVPSIEKDMLYSIDKSGNVNPIMYICNDPSHPPIVEGFGQKTLYQQISEKVEEYVKEGVEHNEITSLMSEQVVSMLSSPSDNVNDGGRLQSMRRQIARDWGEVFCKLDNLGYLTGWFINECQLDSGGGELHYVLGLFSFEATRTLFATVNQLRAGLASETVVYWRTLYETLIKSRFILRFSKVDADLPGRFLYYTNSAYLKFYTMFAPDDDPHAEDNMWIEAERQYEVRFGKREDKGNYGWIFPLIRNKNDAPVTFWQIINKVDKGSKFSKIYYRVSTAKSHGQLVWSPLMVRPEGRGTHIDPFGVGNIALVMDLMMPLFEEILENTAESCGKPEHSVVMGIVKAAIADINNSVAEIKASDPEMHGSIA